VLTARFPDLRDPRELKVPRALRENAGLSGPKVQWDRKAQQECKESLGPRVIPVIPEPKVLKDRKETSDLRVCLEILGLRELREFPESKVLRAPRD
jgi:hypothetical protein